MNCKSLISIAAVLTTAIVACTPAKQPNEPKEPEVKPVNVMVTEVTNLTPTFIASISGVEEDAVFSPGDEITLKLTPGSVLTSGFAATHMEHIHIHVGDKIYMPEFPVGASEYINEITYTFQAPEKDFPIVVAYAVQQQLKADGYTMTLEENSDNVGLYGVSPDVKYKYFDCYLRTPDAYTINKVEFKVGDGEWTDITTVQGCGFSRTESFDWVYNVSVRPNYQDVTGDVVLRVNGTQHARYKITWKNTEYVKTDIPADWQQNYFPTESIDGETVTAVFYTLDDYYLNGATSNISGLELKCIARAYVTFKMPATDVEVSLDFKEKIPVSYAGGTNIKAAEIYSDKDIYYGVPVSKGIPGEAVYLFASAEKDYMPYKAYDDKGNSFKFVVYGDGIDRYSSYAEVLIPEDATSLKITADAVAVHYVIGDNIVVEGGSAHAAGDEISFTVYIPEGKKLDNVKVTGASGTEYSCTMDGPQGTFTMPDENVYIFVTYADLPSGDTVFVQAFFDENQYRVNSSTNYDWDFAEGFSVATGTNIYLSVYDDYGEPFWVGLKVGETVSYYEAQADEDTGEYTFGRSFTASADTQIKVGATKSSVEF